MQLAAGAVEHTLVLFLMLDCPGVLAAAGRKMLRVLLAQAAKDLLAQVEFQQPHTLAAAGAGQAQQLVRHRGLLLVMVVLGPRLLSPDLQ